MDESEIPFQDCPIWAEYLEYRVHQERPGSLPNLDIIRETAEKLAQEDEISGSIDDPYREYVSKLCGLTVKYTDCSPGDILSSQALASDRDTPIQQHLLTAAAAFNKPLLVRRLLLASWSNFDRSRLFGNPWRQAAENGNGKVFDVFTEDPFRFSSYSAWIALSLASRRGHAEIVRQMLEPRWIPPTITELRIWSTLLTSSVECFEIFEAWRENTPFRGPLTQESLCNLIENAAKNGWTDMLRHLISIGAPVNGHRDGVNNKSRPMTCASENGHKDSVQVLLDNGAFTKRSDLLGAIKHGQPGVVRLLLDHGVQTKGSVVAAARKGYFGILQMLVSHGADVNEEDPPPIVVAAAAEHMDMVRYLIEHGATQPPPDTLDEASEAVSGLRVRMSRLFGRSQ